MFVVCCLLLVECCVLFVVCFVVVRVGACWLRCRVSSFVVRVSVPVVVGLPFVLHLCLQPLFAVVVFVLF